MSSENAKQEFSNHQACETLTGITLEHLPPDGRLGHLRTYHKGTEVWEPDDVADRIYFLKKGQVAVMTSDVKGHEIIINVIKVGEPFGELCFCSEEKGLRMTTARAVIKSEAVEINYKEFMKYLQSDAKALHSFVITFCQRLSDSERRNEVLAHRGAEDRLGKLLLHLVSTRGHSSAHENDKVILHVSHDELAQMAAMSRSHVTVTMGKLRRQNLVFYERSRPLTVDVPLLTAYLNRG
ncbi:MAG: Crp/Fnr family transcriptional regulator [Acidobacteriota bacterium]|nr:Crp/Fnr family transcriptional regulator [Acidobacteriota bacterium]